MDDDGELLSLVVPSDSELDEYFQPGARIFKDLFDLEAADNHDDVLDLIDQEMDITHAHGDVVGARMLVPDYEYETEESEQLSGRP